MSGSPHPVLRNALLLVLLLAVSGCAAGAYDAVTDRKLPSPDLAQVRTDPPTYAGMQARWGGRIARVENRAEETWVEVVQHPLTRDGRPRRTDATEGRFIARVGGFLDPVVYAAGREITVVGSVEAPVTRIIGQRRELMPVLAATAHRLWAERPEVYVDPFFYDPYWPWGFNSPLWHRHHRHHHRW